MGLLSDPEPGISKWMRMLEKVHKPVSFLCVFAGLIWFFMLGHNSFNNATYFSENALLPGLVRSGFNEERSANQFYTECLEELEKNEGEEQPLKKWIINKMASLDLEVHTHNFSLKYPMGQKQIFLGTNIYGILRAPRTANLEALVVTTPVRPVTTFQKNTVASIALMLAFAKFAKSQKYWAKDIIFLVTEHEQLGLQAWLEAYHGLTGNYETFYSSLGTFGRSNTKGSPFWKLRTNRKKTLDPGILVGRSGAIQAAVNLELDTPKLKYIEVKIEGLNGQLPNLDLVNLAHKMCMKAGIHHSFKYSYSWIDTKDEMKSWKNNILTMLAMMQVQVAGVPNGNHGLFHKFGIDAVTLEGRSDLDPAGKAPRVKTLQPSNFYRLGVALEGMLRSLNNLLERFHQSYFFYVLAASDRFISIGHYMPALCLFVAAFLIKAFALWVSIQPEQMSEAVVNDDTEQIKKEDGKDETPDSDGKERGDFADDVSKLIKSKEETKTIPKYRISIQKIDLDNSATYSIGTNYLIVHIIGYLVMRSPKVINKYALQYSPNMQPENSLCLGLAGIALVLVVVMPYLPKVLRSSRLSKEELLFVNGLVLLELSTACLTVGMHNFPLGMFLCVAYAPLALFVGVNSKSNGRFRRLLQQFLCLLLHPLVGLTLIMIFTSYILFPEEKFKCIFRGKDALVPGVMFAYIDSAIYGNWVFNMVCTVILPVWLLFWQIVCNPVK